VGATHQIPLSGSGYRQPYAYDDETAANWESLSAEGRWVSPGYFEAIGTRLLAGRVFSHQDDSEAPWVVVVDEKLARKAWPEGNAVGQRLQLDPEGDDAFAEVIGVVEHVRMESLEAEGIEAIYHSNTADPSGGMTLIVRSENDPESLMGPVREVLRQMNPDLPLTDLRPISALVGNALAPARFSLLVMTLFGGTALLLAALGIYGVVAHSVEDRRHELMMRQVLGAEPKQLKRRIIVHGMKLVAGSLLAGIVVSLALSRFLDSVLVGVSPTDPVTYVAVVVFLTIVSLIACYIPSWRVTRIDPAEVVRSD
jgi:predicted lysophospholipase L1 biosynthesis ABC-type transport system permease subunit